MSRSTRHPAEMLAEQIADRAKAQELHGWRDFTGTLVLATFRTGDRVAIWAGASHDNKRGLVMQALRAKQATFDTTDVDAFVAAFDEKYTGGTHIAPTPPAALVTDELRQIIVVQQAALAEALRDAVGAETDAARDEARDAARMHERERNAAHRALDFFQQGVRPLIDTAEPNTYLVPSSEGNGKVYRITNGVCGYKAGVQGHACWHSSLVGAYLCAYDRHGLALELGSTLYLAAPRARTPRTAHWF